MGSVNRSARVPYSVEQMFALVNDIAAYPAYMPGCLGADILRQTPELVEARLTLGKSGIVQSFVTRNQLQPPGRMVMTLIDGPFKSFDGCWQFQELQNAVCQVSLDMRFEFSNPLLGLAAGRLIEGLAGQQVDALVQRAKVIYES